MPSPLVALILGLAAYRLTRLAGWDDFPLAASIRAWIIGEHWIASPVGQTFETLGDAAKAIAAYEDPDLPGKQPSSEAEAVRPAYDRPTLAHLIHCPFCVGFWISCLVYFGWVAAGAPGEAVHSWYAYPVMPFAISGFVGIVAKNLDA